MQTTIKSMSFLTQKSIISLHNLQCHPRDKQKTCSNKSMLSQLDLRWLFCFNSWKMVDFFNLLCTRSLKYCSIIHYQTISFRTGPLYHVNSNPYPTAIAVGFLCQLWKINNRTWRAREHWIQWHANGAEVLLSCKIYIQPAAAVGTCFGQNQEHWICSRVIQFDITAAATALEPSYPLFLL